MICPNCGYDCTIKNSTVDEIIDVVCGYFDISRDELLKPRKFNKLVKPRHIAIYLCIFHTSLSLVQLGYFFGGKHHTTMMNARKRIINAIQTNNELVDDLRIIENKLGFKPNHFYKPKRILQIA